MIGIFWLDSSANIVAKDDANWLRTILSGYIKAGVTVDRLPLQLGKFSLIGLGKVRALWFTSKSCQNFVGNLIDNPNKSGLPFDGKDGCLEHIDPPRDKPKLIKKDPPGFGWNPYEDD